MPKIAYQYEYQTDVKDIEFTPHKAKPQCGVRNKRKNFNND